jgi:hypothetical protein
MISQRTTTNKQENLILSIRDKNSLFWIGKPQVFDKISIRGFIY